MPPPPPPPPGPPPPPLLPAAPPVGGAVDPKNRNLLLQSIRAGTTLKKTVTKDRSAPIISRKSVISPSEDSDRRQSNFRTGSATIDRTNGLAGLFSEGMPKLKPIGINLGQPQTGSLSSLPTVNVSSLHNNNTSHNAPVRTEHHIKRTVDPKHRGPPPPAPTQKPVFPTSASDSTLTVGPGSHVRSQSNVSLPNGTRSGKPSSKPQLAPKPPAPAPPRKLPTRTQSMRAPASPPVLPPNASAPSFTLPTNELNNRTQPAFHASIDSLLLRGRPRTKPPPPPRSAVPPPPPPSQPPPPPPPHRTLPITRVAPPLPSGVPPQPPMRHSSIRNGANMNGDFETRFGDMFHSANEFPIPPPFRGVLKVYNSKTAKQQAPQPPITHLQLGNKMWARDTSTC